jgi:DNA-binding transcriptional LysR family regulator
MIRARNPRLEHVSFRSKRWPKITYGRVAAGLGVGFAPEWVQDLPNRAFELKKVRGIDFRIGLGLAWNKDDPTASRDDIVDIARSLARPGRRGAARGSIP